MKLKKIGPAESDFYNQFSSSCPESDILQAYEWGDVKAKTGWIPYRYMVLDDGGRPLASVSILEYRIPYIGRSFFYAPRGPVGDRRDKEAFSFLFRELEKEARGRKAVFLKIDPAWPSDDKESEQFLFSEKFKKLAEDERFGGTQPRCNFRLNIEKSEEDLLASFHQKTRYNIRLSAKKGVEIQASTDPKDLKAFYKVHQETAERDKFLIRSLSYYSDLWENLYPKGQMRLFLARYQGEVIAGTISFRYGDQAWYTYGASSNRHRNVMPNYGIQWEMIRWAKAQGCRWYDFRGVPCDYDPENPLSGLIRFKAGFNPELVSYLGEYDEVYSPFWYGVYQLMLKARQYWVHRRSGKEVSSDE